MVFHITVFKKGISSLELAKVFDIDEKTAFRFREKVQDAMGAWLSKEKDKRVTMIPTKLDSIIIGNRGEDLNGLQRLEIVVEEYRRGSSRNKITRFQSSILSADNIDHCELVAGRYVDENKLIGLWNFKTWLTGVHHHCSIGKVHRYENEFLFRLNNRHRQDMIWHILIGEMMLAKPHYLYSNAA
ncbi:MAG: hypothetical protein EOO01_24035 [Chitinophagaceae bacterium]|nr:MAG: hypothetical protein EOO01_24035 [Chitinophagaceae bacterium]